MNEEIKNKIIQVAMIEFFRFGTSVTMEDLSKKLKISKKTLYKYFNNKNEIIDEVIEKLFILMENIFINAFKKEKDPMIILENILTNIALNIASKMSNKFFEDIFKYNNSKWKKIDQIRSEKFNKYFPVLFKDGIEKGYFRKDIDYEILLLVYLNSVQNIINPKTISKYSFSAKEALMNIIKIIFQGITTEKGKRKFNFKKISGEIYEKNC